MGSIFRNPHWLLTENGNSSKESNFSLNFDSSASDHIDLGVVDSSSDLKPSPSDLTTNGFSISVWVYLDSLSNSPGIWQNDGLGISNYAGLALAVNTDGKLNVYYNQNNGAGSQYRRNYLTTAGYITTGSWIHLVVVYNGAGSNPTVYKNNTLFSGTWTNTGSGNNSTMPQYSTTGKSSIGIVRNGTQYLDGRIFGLALFNYTLSSTNVGTLYGNSTNGPGDPLSLTTKPVAYYKMSDDMFYDGTSFMVPNTAKELTGSGNVMSLNFDGITKRQNFSPEQSDRAKIYQYNDNAMTMSVWFKADSAGLRNLLGGGGWFQYFGMLGSNGYLYNYDGGWRALTNYSIADGEWHHVVAKIGADTNVWVDGVNTYTKSPTPSRHYTSNLTSVGAYSNGTIRLWNGNVSQVAVFSGTSVSVSDLYNGGVQPDISGMDDLEILYELNQTHYKTANVIYFPSALNPTRLGLLSASSDIGQLENDAPNGNLNFGTGVNITTGDLKPNGPLSSKNSITRNGGNYRQLSPLSAGDTTTSLVTVADPTKMQMTMQTGLRSDATSKEVSIRFATTPTNVTIDWGDGSTTTNPISGYNNHTYANHGVYTVTLGGVDAQGYVRYNNANQARSVISIDHWGSDYDMVGGYLNFRGAVNNDVLAEDVPTFSNPSGNGLGYHFQSNHRLHNFNRSISKWNITTEKNFLQMFSGCSALADLDLTDWNLTGTGFNFSNMFTNCSNFTGDINWDVEVSNSQQMLMSAFRFNNSLSNMTFTGTLQQMIRAAASFNQTLNLSSTVYNIYNICSSNHAWEGGGMSTFDPSSLTNKSNSMQILFYDAAAFNADISGWDVSSFTVFDRTFFNCQSFARDLSSWDTSNSTTGNACFQNCFLIPRVPTNWSSATNMQACFQNCDVVATSDMENLQLDAMTNGRQIVAYQNNLNGDLGGWDLGNCTSLYMAVRSCSSMSRANTTSTLTRWAIGVYNGTNNKGINMAYIFYQSNSSAGGFDNSRTTTAAGATFSWPTTSANYTLSKTGEPDTDGSGDYCKVVEDEDTGKKWLEAKDMACSSTAGTDFIEFKTDLLEGSVSTVTVSVDYFWNHSPSGSSTTGVTAEYAINGGSWVNFIDDTASGLTTDLNNGTYEEPLVGSVTISSGFSTSFQVRVRLQAGEASACIAALDKITITSTYYGYTNKEIYVQDFSNQELGTGYENTTSATPTTAPQGDPWTKAGDALDYLTNPVGGKWYPSAGTLAQAITRHN